MTYKTTALITAFCGVMANSAMAAPSNFDENLCTSEITESNGLTPLDLVDGFNILSAATGKPTLLFFDPNSKLHFTATPPMFGYPALFRMHDDEKWCYISGETFEKTPKILVNPNNPSFDA